MYNVISDQNSGEHLISCLQCARCTKLIMQGIQNLNIWYVDTCTQVKMSSLNNGEKILKNIINHKNLWYGD